MLFWSLKICTKKRFNFIILTKIVSAFLTNTPDSRSAYATWALQKKRWVRSTKLWNLYLVIISLEEKKDACRYKRKMKKAQLRATVAEQALLVAMRKLSLLEGKNLEKVPADELKCVEKEQEANLNRIRTARVNERQFFKMHVREREVKKCSLILILFAHRGPAAFTQAHIPRMHT